MRKILWIAASLAVLGATTETWAGPRRMQRAVERQNEAQAPTVVSRGRSPAVAPNGGRYPKYTGGFHSRELQNIGVPTGDTGLRGNGFSMYPW